MSEVVDVVIGAGGAPWELRLVRALQEPALGVRVTRRCADHGELLGSALRDVPRAVLVDGALPWVDRDFLLTMRRAGIAVLAIGGSDRALDAIGALHFGPDVTAVDLAAALHSMQQPERSPIPHAATVNSAETAIGRLVAVWSGPGAPGRTSVAIHLATEAARSGIPTLLLDADVWSASVAQTLQLAESPSIAQAARESAVAEPDPVHGAVQAGPHGLAVMAGLPRSELWPELREGAWGALLAAVTMQYALVVVDLAAPIEHDEELAYDRVPFRRNLVTTIALERADDVVMVVASDPIGLRRAVVAYHTLHEVVPTAPGRVHAVLNRVPRAGRRLQECSHAVGNWMGTPPAGFLPAEPLLDRVKWEGRTLHDIAPRSRWLRELRPVIELVA